MNKYLKKIATTREVKFLLNGMHKSVPSETRGLLRASLDRKFYTPTTNNSTQLERIQTSRDNAIWGIKQIQKEFVSPKAHKEDTLIHSIVTRHRNNKDLEGNAVYRKAVFKIVNTHRGQVRKHLNPPASFKQDRSPLLSKIKGLV